VSRLGAPGVADSTIGNYALVAGQALRTLVVARVLGPASFGILNIANVAASFTPQSDIGTGRIGEQRASEARGRGDLVLSDHELTQAAGARMAPALLLCAVLGAGAVVLLATGAASEKVMLSIAFVAVSAPLQSAWWAVLGWLRVHGQFSQVVRSQVGQVVLWLTAVPAGAYAFGLHGALFAMALSFVPPVLIASRRAPLWELVRPRWSAFRRLVRPGVPVWLIFAATFAFTNVDQFVAAGLLGAHAAGIYAIGLLSMSALLALSDGAAAAAHPRTLEEYGRAGHLAHGLPSVVRVMHLVQVAFGVLVPLSWIGLSLVTTLFLTDYQAVLPVAALLGAAASLDGTTTASNSALLAVGKHRHVPWLLAGATVVRGGLAVVLVQAGAGIVGIAVSALAASLLYTVAYLVLVAQAFSLSGRGMILFLLDHLVGSLVLTILAVIAAMLYASDGVGGLLKVAVIALPVCAAVQAFATWLGGRSRPRLPRSSPSDHAPREDGHVDA
jgi:O-antigen/teichoic acid export membrane protein